VGPERLVEIRATLRSRAFQAPKVLWLRDEEPANFERVGHVLLPKDYIRYRLTGEFATDASDAAGTLFLDLRERRWSPEVLAALDVPVEWLPDVFESPEPTGSVHHRVADELGLPPVSRSRRGGGDQRPPPRPIGTGRSRTTGRCRARSGHGSGRVGFAHAEGVRGRSVRADPRLRARRWPGRATWPARPSTLSRPGVAAAGWRELTGLDYDELVAEARPSRPAPEGLVFLPYLTGGSARPTHPGRRGGFVGLRARHSRGH